MLRAKPSLLIISCTRSLSSSLRMTVPPPLSLLVKCITIFITVGLPVTMSFRANTFELGEEG